MARNRVARVEQGQATGPSGGPAAGSGRGVGFPVMAARLALSLVADLFSSTWHFLWFLVHPAPVRERMGRLILEPRPLALLPDPAGDAPVSYLEGGPEAEPEAVGAGSAVRYLVLIACALFVLQGCVAETGLYRDKTPHPGTSLERQWEELVWSTQTLLRMDDWQESLHDDLRQLFSIERGQFRETLELWGW
jgi:hypothetical protein